MLLRAPPRGLIESSSKSRPLDMRSILAQRDRLTRVARRPDPVADGRIERQTSFLHEHTASALTMLFPIDHPS
jgi:hypothetical protein